MKLSESEASVKQAQAAQGNIDKEACSVGPNVPAVAVSSSSKRCKFEGKKVIISIHIPKTGGTAFLQILKPVATEILYLDYGNQVFSPNALYRHGQKVHETFESFGDLERLPGRSVIHGHFHSGKYLK